MTLSVLQCPSSEESGNGTSEKTYSTPKFIIGCSDEDLEDEENENEIVVVEPPDGGWGWVVVAASFLCNAIVDGIIFTSGMLYPRLKDTFNATNSDVAWISALLGGFYLVIGPFVSALVNAFGFRLVCILGAVLGCLACIASYFSTSIYFIYLSYGVLGGIGLGFIYVPAVVTTGFYFEKRRALATGIAVCGSGIGTFVMSPVNTYLLSEFGENWNKIFFVYAGIILCCSIFGLAFRPLSTTTGKRRRQKNDGCEVQGTPLLMRIKILRDKELAQCASALSMYSNNSRTQSKVNLDDQNLINSELKPLSMAHALLERHRSPNKHFSYTGSDIESAPEPIEEESENNIEEDEANYQTLTSIQTISRKLQNNERSSSLNFINNESYDKSGKKSKFENAYERCFGPAIDTQEHSLVIPETPPGVLLRNESGSAIQLPIDSQVNFAKSKIDESSLKTELHIDCHEKSKTFNDATQIKNSIDTPGNDSMSINTKFKAVHSPQLKDERKCLRIMSAPSFNYRPQSICTEKQKKSSKTSLKVITEACPFYRDDVFYSGSLARIHQSINLRKVVGSEASVVNLSPGEYLSEEVLAARTCGASMKYVLSKIFDFSLLFSPTFIILAVSGFFSLTSLFVPFNFLPSYSRDIGLDKGDVSFLLSLIGFCNTLGRIIAGWISDHPKVDALAVNNWALIVGGIATVALPSLTDISLLYCYAIIFGLSIAAFASLRSILLVELMGLEKLTNAFGLILLFQGFAAAFGSPIAGVLVDLTGEYKVSFHVFGCLFALSGLLCIPLRMVKRWEERRLDEKLRNEKYGFS